MQGVGARERQEDSFAVCNASDRSALEREGFFAGGVRRPWAAWTSGNEASEAAVEAFLQLFHSLLAEGDIPRQLREGTLAVSDGSLPAVPGAAAAPRRWRCGSRGGGLHWISVGDSAIFLKRGECVFQLNREQTCLNDLYLRELRQEPIQKERAEGDEDARRLTAFVGIDCLEQVDQSLRPWGPPGRGT